MQSVQSEMSTTDLHNQFITVQQLDSSTSNKSSHAVSPNTIEHTAHILSCKVKPYSYCSDNLADPTPPPAYNWHPIHHMNNLWPNPVSTSVCRSPSPPLPLLTHESMQSNISTTCWIHTVGVCNEVINLEWMSGGWVALEWFITSHSDHYSHTPTHPTAHSLAVLLVPVLLWLLHPKELFAVVLELQEQHPPGRALWNGPHVSVTGEHNEVL